MPLFIFLVIVVWASDKRRKRVKEAWQHQRGIHASDIRREHDDWSPRRVEWAARWRNRQWWWHEVTEAFPSYRGQFREGWHAVQWQRAQHRALHGRSHGTISASVSDMKWKRLVYDGEYREDRTTLTFSQWYQQISGGADPGTLTTDPDHHQWGRVQDMPRGVYVGLCTCGHRTGEHYSEAAMIADLASHHHEVSGSTPRDSASGRPQRSVRNDGTNPSRDTRPADDTSTRPAAGDDTRPASSNGGRPAAGTGTRPASSNGDRDGDAPAGDREAEIEALITARDQAVRDGTAAVADLQAARENLRRALADGNEEAAREATTAIEEAENRRKNAEDRRTAAITALGRLRVTPAESDAARERAASSPAPAPPDDDGDADTTDWPGQPQAAALPVSGLPGLAIEDSDGDWTNLPREEMNAPQQAAYDAANDEARLRWIAECGTEATLNGQQPIDLVRAGRRRKMLLQHHEDVLAADGENTAPPVNGSAPANGNGHGIVHGVVVTGYATEVHTEMHGGYTEVSSDLSTTGELVGDSKYRAAIAATNAFAAVARTVGNAAQRLESELTLVQFDRDSQVISPVREMQQRAEQLLSDIANLRRALEGHRQGDEYHSSGTDASAEAFRTT
jgi:hypothetical protein